MPGKNCNGERRGGRSGAEGRPGPAEQRRIGDFTSRHRREEGRGNDVAEAEGAVTQHQRPPLRAPLSHFLAAPSVAGGRKYVPYEKRRQQRNRAEDDPRLARGSADRKSVV